jgi:hypothetical protein
MEAETEKAKRYEAALNGIIFRARGWKQLMDVWEEVGEGVTEIDRAIWRAYLGNAYDAAMALGLSRQELLKRITTKA